MTTSSAMSSGLAGGVGAAGVSLPSPGAASEFYEPWHPQVGDRVQYRWQPECPGVYGMLAPVGHPREYDSMRGTVYEILRGSDSHPYLVRLDEGSLTRAISAAAIELEPVDAEGPGA